MFGKLPVITFSRDKFIAPFRDRLHTRPSCSPSSGASDKKSKSSRDGGGISVFDRLNLLRGSGQNRPASSGPATGHLGRAHGKGRSSKSLSSLLELVPGRSTDACGHASAQGHGS